MISGFKHGGERSVGMPNAVSQGLWQGIPCEFPLPLDANTMWVIGVNVPRGILVAPVAVPYKYGGVIPLGSVCL